MGNSQSALDLIIRNRIRNLREATHLVTAGPEGSGKSTILQTLGADPAGIKDGITTIEHDKFKFTVVDVGGERQAPANELFDGAHGLAFTVDSTKPDGFTSAGAELHQLLVRANLKGAPLLVLATKHDLPGAVGVADIAEKLGLAAITGRVWHIQGASALSPDSLGEGLNWLSANVAKD